LRQRFHKEIHMKTALFVAGGLICMSAWHANAQETTADPTTAAQASTANSEGPDASATSMSGGPAMFHAKTRADVYQDLVRSQQDGQAARLQELYKGN
jgi:hypothetical protein